MLAAFLRSDVGKAIIGFLILLVLFWILESLWPEDRKQPKVRKGMITDVLYFFILIPGTRLLTTVVIAIAVFFTLRFIPHRHVPLIADQPTWAQALEILLIGDLIGYWTHRAFHNFSLLWPFHAVHHSSEQVDWLSSVRVHPLDTVASKLCVTLPIFLLGFSGTVLAPYTLFLAIYPILLHANVSWTYGPFKYVIASPSFHRWHHAAEEVSLYKNFSGLFPIFDMLFGTAYFPNHKPAAYGLYQDHLSNNIFAQLWYPFRRRPPSPPAPQAPSGPGVGPAPYPYYPQYPGYQGYPPYGG